MLSQGACHSNEFPDFLWVGRRPYTVVTGNGKTSFRERYVTSG